MRTEGVSMRGGCVTSLSGMHPASRKGLFVNELAGLL